MAKYVESDLKTLLESFNIFKIREKENYITKPLRKNSFDNASKTSSGYNDERSTDEETDDDVLAYSDSCISDSEAGTLSARKSYLKVIDTLPQYPPSEDIKIAKDLNFSIQSLKENNAEIIKTYLSDLKLNKDNIHLVYKMLLEMEDVTCMAEYVPLAQKNVNLNCTGMAREYWISLKDCPNIDDIVTPLVDQVVLVPKASSEISNAVKFKTDLLLPHIHEETYERLYRRCVASVQTITKDRVYFRFSKQDILPSLVTNTYDLILRSQRIPLRYQYRAIELLAENDTIRDYLFSKENPRKELIKQPPLNFNLLNPTIASNPEQLEAVRHITEGTNSSAPFVVFGPPGTGKTTLAVEAILQIRLHHPSSRILVTAGSNSACDTIAIRLCKYFDRHPQLKMLKNSLIRIYSISVVEKGIKLIDPQLLKYSNLEKRHHYYPSVEEIRTYGIVVATLTTVGKLVTANVGYGNNFTHIFMDEAGASTVPEALVGVMGIKLNSDCRLILSGDHKQLGPIIKSERAAELGLQQSIMEHLLSINCYAMNGFINYDRTIQARLRRNYRSHPEIVKLYNHLYYNDELIAEAAEENVNLAAKWCKLPNPKFPIIFQAVHGKIEKDSTSPSSYNNLEIEVVMWFLRRFLNDGIDGKIVKETDIGIITPYKLQSKRIQDRINACGWRRVECGCVETFQGREKEIIIVSLVRSFSGLGFVNNPKRLNVLLSRPQSLLILIGNPLTLKRSSDFAYILNECEKHGTFLRKKKTR